MLPGSGRLGLVALGLVLLGVATAHADPIQWSTASGGNDHWYASVSCNDCSWNEARVAAEAMSWQGQPGHLATLTSAAEDAWVWANLGHPCLHWLGGLQPSGSPEPAGGWIWVTGEPWSYTNWWSNVPVGGPAEPNSSYYDFSPEDYLQYDHNCGFGWNDFPNDPYAHDVPGFIVEFEPGLPNATEARSWGSLKSSLR